jgi:beta-glucuronidase
VFTLFVLAGIVLRGLGQQPLQTLLVGVDHRTNVASLDGDWHYLVDYPPFRALYAGGGAINDRGYALNSHPNITSGPHNDEYDFATAPTLKVPGDWNTQVPQFFSYEGVVFYERDFDAEPKPGSRSFLHIGAANYRSHVWVNRKRVCDHEGEFTPFDCELTAVLHPGSNFIVIGVDATRLQDSIPSVGYDWYNYGGLTRGVSLVTVPTAFIDDYDIHLAHGPAWQPDNRELTGYVHVLGAPAGTPVTIDVPEAGARTTVNTDAEGNARFSVTAARLTLWSPEFPKLYKVGLSSGADKLTDDIGFRDVRVDGTRILLNGRAVFLKGVNVHAEAPIRGGRADNDQDVAMLNEMIRRDRNKASVILWSMSNETGNNPVRTRFLADLANEARQLDPTRLITSALNTDRRENAEGTLVDPLIDALDVVGLNEYIGWYGDKPEDADTIHWTLPQKPLIMSEFGAEAKIGNHGPVTQRWTYIYRHQLVMFSKIPQLRGTTPWVLLDFRSTTRNIPIPQDGYNRKGLLSEDGKKKQAFFIMQEAYKDTTVGKAE